MADPAEDRGDDLAPDATLATDIPDEEALRAEQMKYYGGDVDDVDTENLAEEDRGDSIEVPELDELEEDEEEDDDTIAEETDDTISEDEEEDDEEEDDEEEDDEEEVEAEAEEEEEEEKPADQRIPIGRFNEVNERMKRAEARLAELEKQEQAAEDVVEGRYDFDAAEEEYTELLLNGDTKGAATKRAEIRAAERESFLQEANASTQTSISQDAMFTELNSLSSQAAEMYPLFDDKHADFDEVATQKVLTFMRGYLSDESVSMTPGDAFVAALADSIELYDLDARYGYAEEVADEEPAPKKKAAKKKVKEKLEVAEKQAKSPLGQGRASGDAGAAVPNIEKMSDAEIDALPADTLARLRGDYMD